MSTLQLRGIEEAKIQCARRFFDELNAAAESNRVKYEVVSDYASLLALVNTA